MLYPEFPRATENPTPKGYYPKDDLNDIMETYDEFISLGLQPLPKQYNKKLPDFRFWEKDSKPDFSRDNILNTQSRNDISGWCLRCGHASNRLFVIDIDTNEVIKAGNDPVLLYEQIQARSLTKFVLKTPSNGVHMYYRIPSDKEMLGNSAPPISGLDVRGEGGQVVTLHGYNRYDNTADKLYAEHKGVVDGHTAAYEKMQYGDYTHIPDMSDELYEWLIETQPQKRPKTKTQIKGENYGKTSIGVARIERHFNQPNDKRTAIIVECLQEILSEWHANKSYDDWIQLWMAAHHGSDGSIQVRDILLEHPNVYWSDGVAGQRHFRRAWDEHIPDEDGFTVASLFYLARQAGWLSSTGFELTEGLAETIDVKYISDWLDEQLEIPRRVLIKSQTGSGKTWTMAKLWRRLGEPKAVVFVPTIKLATELSYSLKKEHDVDAFLYIDDETQKIKKDTRLISAHFLVTTLQTFATKVAPHINMRDYGMVYIEESDQLISQFSRGGAGSYGTHVSDRESRKGFAVLREAFSSSGCVWLVDATMTKISYYTAMALRGGHEVRVIINKRIVEKPPIIFLDSKGVAYQEVLRELERGGKVVVSSDTKSVAYEVYETMRAIGALDNKNAILITADTKHRNDVKDFMRDVNAGAEYYDFVSYSPVMASGVSITSVAPDLLVQFSTWLTPRNNLQMLNRYRVQNKVVAFYSDTERLYGKKAQEVIEEAEERAWIEARNVKIPLAVRNSDAELKAKLASMSIGDTELQMRSPKEFYLHLLANDGRSFEWESANPVSKVIKHTIKGVREAKKKRKEEIAKRWREVPPIDRNNPPKPEYTDLDVAKGEVHAYIERCLFGNIPDDVDNEELYRIVKDLGKHGYKLDAFIKQEHTLQKAETYLADDGRAITSLANNVTMIKVVSLVRYLYDDLYDVLDYDKVKDRCAKFLEELELRKDMYDSVVARSRQKHEVICEKNEDLIGRTLAFSKIMLSTIGMKQRASRDNRVDGEATYVYNIQNADDVVNFLSWRNSEPPNILFSDKPVTDKVSERADENTLFRNLSPEEQEQVFMKMRSANVDFKMAVRYVTSQDKFKGF